MHIICEVNVEAQDTIISKESTKEIQQQYFDSLCTEVQELVRKRLRDYGVFSTLAAPALVAAIADEMQYSVMEDCWLDEV